LSDKAGEKGHEMREKPSGGGFLSGIFGGKTSHQSSGDKWVSSEQSKEMRDKAEETRQKVVDKGHEMRDKVGEKAQQMSDDVSKAAHSAQEEVSHLAEKAKNMTIGDKPGTQESTEYGTEHDTTKIGTHATTTSTSYGTYGTHTSTTSSTSTTSDIGDIHKPGEVPGKQGQKDKPDILWSKTH
jgi:hypothetical protein